MWLFVHLMQLIYFIDVVDLGYVEWKNSARSKATQSEREQHHVPCATSHSKLERERARETRLTCVTTTMYCRCAPQMQRERYIRGTLTRVRVLCVCLLWHCAHLFCCTEACFTPLGAAVHGGNIAGGGGVRAALFSNSGDAFLCAFDTALLSLKVL